MKLGAHSVLAVDHDPQAVLATRDNAARNAVTDRISVVHTDDFDAKPADLVLANILANVLITLADQITGLLTPGGDLVMSGILRAQTGDVAHAYADRLDFVDEQTRDDWALMHARARR